MTKEQLEIIRMPSPRGTASSSTWLLKEALEVEERIVGKLVNMRKQIKDINKFIDK